MKNHLKIVNPCQPIILPLYQWPFQIPKLEVATYHNIYDTCASLYGIKNGRVPSLYPYRLGLNR